VDGRLEVVLTKFTDYWNVAATKLAGGRLPSDRRPDGDDERGAAGQVDYAELVTCRSEPRPP